ncbi:MAG: hypothetical protein KGL39_38470 [Patescibacteria group bacterium]|nr:hypothetical protein [Patescibacteria group bacterium]
MAGFVITLRFGLKMRRLRLWFEWLLQGRAVTTVALEKIDSQQREICELRAGLAEAISELNALRNAVSDAPARQTGTAPTVRQFRSWRATVAAIEGRPLPEGPKTILVGGKH